MSTAVTVKVTGRVQGVAFRWYAVQEAERLGVRGWVRNEPDESVAAHLEGEDDAVEAMLAWCRRGPSAAVVRGGAGTEARPTGAAAFEIRYCPRPAGGRAEKAPWSSRTGPVVEPNGPGGRARWGPGVGNV